MSRLALVYVVAVALFPSSLCAAEISGGKSKAIPLDTIWGFKIPGTRDVRELEPKVDLKLLGSEIEKKPVEEREKFIREELVRRSVCQRILKLLTERRIADRSAGEAFVVVGEASKALNSASDVLSGKAERQRVLPAESDLTLVFYSLSSGRYVRLVSVDRWSNVITIRYQFVTRLQSQTSQHFALIPLGVLPPGEYRVNVEQATPVDEGGAPASPVEHSSERVSGSFSFQVRSQER